MLLKKKMILLGSVRQFGVMRFPRLYLSPGSVYFADGEGGGGGGGKTDDEKAAEAEAAKQAQWDKDRQHKDEINAANKRQEESDAALDAANDELETAQSKLAEMEAEQLLLKEAADKATADADDAETEKGLGHYENMITEVTAQKKLIADMKETQTAQAAEIAKHQKTNEQRDAEVEQQVRDQEGLVLLNKMCIELEKDSEFSGLDRNIVLDGADKAYREGKISSLDGEARQRWIGRELKLQYIDAAEVRKNDKSSDSTDKKKKDGIRVDSGHGGDPPTNDIKAGTGDQVYEQMKAIAERQKAGGG